MTTNVDLSPSNAYVQATPAVGSVKLCTVDFGGAFFIWSCCVLRVLSDALALRCMMFIFCVKEADWGMMAFVPYFAPWFSKQYTMSFCTYHAQCNAEATPLSKQYWALILSISGWGGGIIRTGKGHPPAPTHENTCSSVPLLL